MSLKMKNIQGLGTSLLCAMLFVCCGKSNQAIVPKLPETGDKHFNSDGKLGGKSVKFDYWKNATLIKSPKGALPPLKSGSKIKRTVLSNGLDVYSIPTEEKTLVDVLLTIRSGRKDEPLSKKGLADLAANTWVDHARGISRKDLIETFDAKGGTLQISVDFDSTRIRCRMIWEERESCLELMGLMLGAKDVSDKVVETEKEKLLRSYRQQRVSLLHVSHQWFRSLLWGPKDAKGQVQSFESVNGLTKKDVRQWYKKHYVSNNAALFWGGGGAGQKDKSMLEKALKGWKQGQSRRNKASNYSQQKGIQLHIVNLPGAKSTMIKMGSRGIDPTGPRHWDELVLATILDKAIQLHPNLKNNTAVVSPHLGKRMNDGTMGHGFVVESFLPHQFGLQAVQNVLDVLRNIKTEPEGVAWLNEFLPRVKKEIGGRLALRSDDKNRQIEDIAKWTLEKDVSYDTVAFSQALPSIDVDAVLKTLDLVMNPDHLTVVLVGDGEVLRNQFDDAGWKYRFTSADDLGRKNIEDLNQNVEEPPLVGGNKKRTAAFLAQALKAKGKSISKMKSLSWRADATLQTRQGKVPAVIRRRIVAPDKLRLDMSIQKGMVEVTTVATATKGWARQKNEKEEQTIELPPAEHQALQGQLWRDPDFVISRLQDPRYVYKWLGKEKINGKNSVMIEVKGDGKRVKLYFDVKTRLLNGMKYVDKGQSATELYSGYKSISGVKIAHKRKIESTDSTLNYKIKKVAVNKKSSTLIFIKPPDAGKRAKDKGE